MAIAQKRRVLRGRADEPGPVLCSRSAAQQPCSSRGASCTNCRPGAVCASVAYLGGPLSQRRVRLPLFGRVQPRTATSVPKPHGQLGAPSRAYSTHRAQLHAEAVLGCTVVVRMIASSPKQASKGCPVLRVTCEHLKACFTIRICRMWQDLSAHTANPCPMFDQCQVGWA